jgi:O-acetyl-ADP-ribose deacetylase (regulator of RNase III)
VITADAYAGAIRLFVPFAPLSPEPEVGGARARHEVLAWLRAEQAVSVSPPTADGEIDVLIRDLLTTRRPGGIPARVQACLDAILAGRARARGSVAASEILTGPGRLLSVAGTPIKVWQGDITRLAVDAIVNAANAEILGCFRPGHACIDNAIHSAAGPRLREDCARIIEIQGHAERSGDAKITRAYNLPSRFVLHTVGPIVAAGRVRPEDERTLVSAYQSCLDLAQATPALRSLALCAISTGVFGYPKDRAAEVAVRTASAWLRERPRAFDLVIFCVFSEEDRRAYDEAMANCGRDRVS